jgi:hypothetical protein
MPTPNNIGRKNASYRDNEFMGLWLANFIACPVRDPTVSPFRDRRHIEILN